MGNFFADIPLSNNWKIIRSIKEGWSDDEKYYIQDDKGHEYLLRISAGNKYEEESQYYNALSKLNRIDIISSKLLDSGLCNNGKNTFRLFTWVTGEELLKKIGHYSEREQYKYGYESGQVLKEIHKIGSPAHKENWAKHYNQKIDKKIELYKHCGITFPGSEQIIDYIQRQRSLTAGRPQSFHHGDFHIGNLLLTPENRIGVIDFNRLDFGDPWEEFNRITWSADKSAWFASGQINGYFNDEVPNGFFELMALYIAVNQIGSLPWAIPFGDKEVTIILNQINEVLSWYENFDQSVPNWYRRLEI
ncbi:MAG: phosphotransferase family protein [Bacteroidetes bacterium]|nr:MAG: phosphotransferase family protein [Bacteroidota bacterium]